MGKIRFVKERLVKALDTGRKVVVLSDGTEIGYDLFLGVPVHRVPQVVVESGLAADAYGWVPVNKKTLETNFPGVYAVGDVNGVGTAKAGVFAEGAARVVAAGIIAQVRGGPSPEAYKGDGFCYVEFGHGQVGKVHVDFLSGPKPVGTFHGASEALLAEKVISDPADSSAGSDNRRRNLGKSNVGKSALGRSISTNL
jgi:sulfide:quinone oxidoreductase